MFIYIEVVTFISILNGIIDVIIKDTVTGNYAKTANRYTMCHWQRTGVLLSVNFKIATQLYYKSI